MARRTYTERRRARLQFQVGTLDRMEERSMITESVGMLSFVLGNPAAAAALFAQRENTIPRAGALRASHVNHASVVPISAARRIHAHQKTGAATTQRPAQIALHRSTASHDWLLLRRSQRAAARTAAGLSPFHRGGLSHNQGGGAAASHGGSAGSGRGNITPIRIPPKFPQTGTTAGGTGVIASAPSAAPSTNAPASAGHGDASAVAATSPSTATTSSRGQLPVPQFAPDTISSTALTSSIGSLSANSAQFTGTFTYFPLYTLDWLDGQVLFDGETQYATFSGSRTAGFEDLRAQVTGTAVSSYSWDTSHLTDAFDFSATNTYRLTWKWYGTITPPVNNQYVTLTVTNNLGQQETQTYYFTSYDSGSFAATFPPPTIPTKTWSQTLSPDQIAPSSPYFASHNVAVDSNTGALDTSITLPTYNPNVAPVVLSYDSQAAAPEPLFVLHHVLDPAQTVPTKVSAQLTFNGSSGGTYYYDTSTWIPGDVQQTALMADATALSTGRYAYSMSVTDYRTSNTTTTPSGTTSIVNESGSALGAGWTIAGLEHIYSASGGVILTLGTGDRSLWFTGSFGSGGGTYTNPAGEFSTLTANSGGGYTRTLVDGTVLNFNSSGQETSSVDRNGLRTTFAYNSGGALSTVTDPYSNVTTFTYDSGGKLHTITDPASRITTFTVSGSNMTGVTLPDSSTWGYAYDGSGRMTQVTDPRSHSVTVAYDSAHRVGTITRPDSTSETFSAYEAQGYDTSGTSGSPATALLLAAASASHTDPNSNTTALRPDWTGLGMTNQVVDPLGYVASADRDTNGLATVTIDRLGRVSLNTYDSKGNVTQHTYPDLYTDQYTYNSFAEPLTHTDANGHKTTFTYDSGGNLTKIQDALSDLTTMTYTAHGMVQTLVDPNGNTTSYAYDSHDRLTTLTHPDNSTMLFAYDSKGNAATVTDERSHVTRFAFDALNRTTAMTDVLGNTATYIYDQGGNLTVDQEPLSRTTTYAYDPMDRLTTITATLSRTTVYGYDSGGRPHTVTDPLSRVTTYSYDGNNNVTTVIDPLGNRTTSTYDAEGETLTVTDPMSRVTTYTYNGRGDVATWTDPLSNVTTFSYSPTRQLLVTTFKIQQAGSPVLTTITYDALDRVVKQGDALGDITTTVYDSGGNIIASVDPNGNRTTYTYDSRNRLIAVTDPLSHTTSYSYDATSNETAVTDALSHSTTYSYDALNRVTSITDARGSVVTLSYDAAGRQTVVIDPNGNRTTYSYDAADRVTTLTDALGTSTFSYNADNELTDKTDHNSRRTTYTYDSGGRQINEYWVTSSGGTLRAITYTYNNDGELTGAIDPDATLTFTYDSGGNQITAATSSTAGQPNVTLTSAYNSLGGRTSLTDDLTNIGRTTYGYDNALRLTSIAQSFGGTSGPQMAFGYDSGGRMTSESRTIGGSGTAVNSTISYDGADRVTTITHQTGSGSALATYVYGYDATNRLTTETNAEGSVTYTYDNANELTGVSGARSESYGYDSGGNRNTTGYTIGSGNEMTASPNMTYSYDAVGNTTGETDTSTGVTTSFAYDYRDRLTGVTVRASGGGITSEETLTYDALDRRIGMDISGVQTWTSYDGLDTYIDFDSAGTVEQRYLYGRSQDEILARTGSGGASNWYLTDRLGSVRDIVTTSASTAFHTGYDSYGNPVNQSGSGGDRFTFAGMEFDSEFSGYNTVFRPYSSTTGRFLAAISLGTASANTNAFAYASNDPTDLKDPLGLAARQRSANPDLNLQMIGSSAQNTLEISYTQVRYQLTMMTWLPYTNEMQQTLEKLIKNGGITYGDTGDDRGKTTTDNKIVISQKLQTTSYYTSTTIIHELFHVVINHHKEIKWKIWEEEMWNWYYEFTMYQTLKIRGDKRYEDTQLQLELDTFLTSFEDYKAMVHEVYPEE